MLNNLAIGIYTHLEIYTVYFNYKRFRLSVEVEEACKTVNLDMKINISRLMNN